MQSEYSPAPRPKKSKAAFDALFADIGYRTDLSPAAKLVYAKLTTMHRLNRAWTMVEIGERVGLSRQGVWRALAYLTRADLVVVTQRGLGIPNSYSLRGIDTDDLNGHADTAESRQRRIQATRRKLLIAQYGEMCLRCGATRDLQIDHVIPTASGGPDVFANLQLLCKPCNLAKGTTIADYRQSPGRPLAGSEPAC